ncbi:uncharacterized protein LOC144877562 isoform X2 [Branchiostoma floridae x Branchiostoma japonicum]
MASVAARNVEEERLTDSQYQEDLKEGDSYLARTDLDSAEKHFAAALKAVHERDPTAQQYQREVEPLCKLGDVYSKRGQQTGDGGDFVKAAALYNAAIVRSEDQVLNGSIEKAIVEIVKSFLKCILDISCNVSLGNKEKHKKQLKEMRDQIKLEMETIDQQLDPYDEDDPCVREIEAKRAQAVRQLFENIAQQRKEFISLLVEECIGLMGPPPCKYALIGLGSQAMGLVTPYSDLEFAILVEEDVEQYKVYFRNLTHYLHLKVVNLGETILPALGIKSLNDFYSENSLESWYYDSVTPRGFAFDGSMPKACKTPLGRQQTKNEPPSELICTPNNMVSILQNDVTLYLKEGYHLGNILKNPCLITGDQELIDTYMAITGEILKADGGKMAWQLAKEVIEKNIKICNDDKKITARLIDVKRELYRFPSIAVDCLALSSGIIPTTVWKTIEEMESQQVISSNNAHHLTVLTSISAELRLRTYIANGGQRESLSALASMETTLHGQESSQQTEEKEQRTALRAVFHLPNEKQIFRYFYSAVPVKESLSTLSEEGLPVHSDSTFYDSSPVVQGKMYYELCKYGLAISYFEKALRKLEGTETGTIAPLLFLKGSACHDLGDNNKAISYYKQALQMQRGLHGETKAHPDIASLLNSFGVALADQGEYEMATTYLEQALQMYKSIHGQETAHYKIANSLNNLGLAFHFSGNESKALTYHEEALQMFKRIYGQTVDHADIATALNILGRTCDDLGNHRKAIKYLEQALQMRKRIYGDSTAHPAIAISLNNMGMACENLGDYNTSVSYHEQALAMRRSIYGQTAETPHIARSLNNLGAVLCKLEKYSKGKSYYEQALEMRKNIHGQDTAHPDFITSLNNVGHAWKHFGEPRKSISYYEQALQMMKNLHGQDKEHPKIGILLRNVGEAWCDAGDPRKAISYIEQALQMFRSLYGQTKAHRFIAMSLDSLGTAWREQGDHRKAITYHEQALEMYRSVFGQDSQHDSIAKSLKNLELARSSLHDSK